MRRGLAIGVVLLGLGVVVGVWDPGRIASRASLLLRSVVAARPLPPKSLSPQAVEHQVDEAIVDIRVVPVGAGSPVVFGTGMILTANGIVLTNNHLVFHARTVTIWLSGHSRAVSARIIGVDPAADVAVLQIPGAQDLPTVTGASGAPMPGTRVIALGNAGGLGGTPKATTGKILGTGATIVATGPAGPETLYGMIETTAPLAPGDSGGPLINRWGLVLGMDTASLNPSDAASGFTGPSFAVPIKTVLAIAERVERHAATPSIYLRPPVNMGIEVCSLAYWAAHYGPVPAFVMHGAAVETVDGQGPARNSGIVPGDFITTFNGRTVTGPGELSRLEKDYRPGDRVTVSWVNAAGESLTADVVLGSSPWP